jgi:hypothetical protein
VNGRTLAAAAVFLGAVAVAMGWVVVVSSSGSSRSLDDLQPDFRDRLVRGLAAVKAAGVDLYVYETLRSEAQEAKDIAAGLSHLKDPKHGRHLPHPPDGKARAADTWVRGVPFQGKTPAQAADIDSRVTQAAQTAAPIMRRFGLVNIDTPTFKDLLHWQDA